MKTKSIWETTISLPEEKKELPQTKTDILIIGSGIAGISTAFHLKDCKKKIMVIDKGRIAMGVTSKTTGKLTYLQGTCYQKIKTMYDLDTSYLYLNSQKESIQIVKDTISKYNIACDLEKVDSYIFANQQNEIKKIKKEEEILKKMNISYQKCTTLPNQYPCKYGIYVSDTYVFHPLKYLLSLMDICKKKGITFYENVCATNIRKKKNLYMVETSQGTIEANTVVICTHYPFFIKPCFIPFKTHIERSYVVASQIIKPKSFSAILPKNPSYSMRYYQNYFIYGGESHDMSHQIDYQKNYEKLQQQYKKYFTSNIDYMWCTHDILTEDHIPYIGRASKQEKNLFIATGFNKWGMTNGTLAGKVLSDLILKEKNEYTQLLAPYRSYTVQRILVLFKNATNTGKIFMRTKLDRNPSFYTENISVFKKDGIYYGKYIDKNGKSHIVYNKCPHMGCSLIFNKKDITWDCPCHGSRFDIDGDIIEGPSTYSIKIKK